MKFLLDLLQPLPTTDEAVAYLLKLHNVKITRTGLEKRLSEHTEYPSMLSIGDTLNSLGVANIAAKLPMNEWKGNVDAPFLVNISEQGTSHNMFAVITKYSDTFVEFYNPKLKRTIILPNEVFDEIYRGVIMAIEADDKSGELLYKENLLKEKKKKALIYISFYTFPIIFILSLLLLFLTLNNYEAINFSLYLLITLCGILITILLLVHEIDQYNPAVKQICQAFSKKRVNCSSILNSKASKIFGITWSSIGFTYFTGSFLLLTVTGFSKSTICILSWLNLLTLPYIFYSILYQWKIAKQWCILCLTIQAVLLIQFIVSFRADFYNLVPFYTISYLSIIGTSVQFILILLFIQILIPFVKNSKKGKLRNTELQKIRHNPKIFEAILSTEKSINTSIQGIGVSLGNPNGKYKIVVVCNPYCSYCAKSHTQIEGLIQYNEEVEVRFIFIGSKGDPIVHHLLEIETQKNPELLKNAINDWYKTPDFNYHLFVKKYPSINLTEQEDRVDAMKNWCISMQIAYTPTFFVNGYQLPSIYSVSDLSYCLI